MRYHVIAACGNEGFSASYATEEEAYADRGGFLDSCKEDSIYYHVELCEVPDGCVICEEGV
jgi:hypothetical protein